jgi:hypothetical protein
MQRRRFETCVFKSIQVASRGQLSCAAPCEIIVPRTVKVQSDAAFGRLGGTSPMPHSRHERSTSCRGGARCRGPDRWRRSGLPWALRAIPGAPLRRPRPRGRATSRSTLWQDRNSPQRYGRGEIAAERVLVQLGDEEPGEAVEGLVEIGGRRVGQTRSVRVLTILRAPRAAFPRRRGPASTRKPRGDTSVSGGAPRRALRHDPARDERRRGGRLRPASARLRCHTSTRRGGASTYASFNLRSRTFAGP